MLNLPKKFSTFVNWLDVKIIFYLKCMFFNNNEYHLFADELLKRGGKEYLLDYIRGNSHSMDTAMNSGMLTISKKKAQELLEYFDELKSITQNTEEKQLLNDYIRNRLEFYANK